MLGAASCVAPRAGGRSGAVAPAGIGPASSGAGQDPSGDTSEEPERGAVSGWTSAHLRFRRTSDSEDLDLVTTTSLHVGDPEHDRISGHLLLYAAADLDGRRFTSGADSDFFGLDDTSRSDGVARLYEAYAEVHPRETLRAVRLGRQSLVDTPEQAWFDGAWVETVATGDRDTRMGLYLGRGVRLYETALDGDRVAGTYVEARPWRAGRVRLDWMHLEDDTRLLSTRDDLWSLRGWQRLNDELRVSGGHTRLGSTARDWFLRGNWFDPESTLGVQARYYELLEPQGTLAWEIDPFSAILFELRPYRQWHVQATKGLGRRASLEAGFALRDVTETKDEGEFNREFDRRHVALNLTELPGEVDLSLTGVAYDDGGTELETWGADLSRDLGSDWRASLGSYYSLYQIDLFEELERDHVRTWYVRARNRIEEGLTLDVRVEYEEGDFDDYFVTRVGLRWAF